MSRRKYYRTERCGEPGCNHADRYEYDLQKDYLEDVRREAGKEHWCRKHHPKAGNIKPGETERIIFAEYIAGKSKRYPNLTGLFWTLNGGAAEIGYVYGNGWNMYADDFPEGTRVTFETKIIIQKPDASAAKAESE